MGDSDDNEPNLSSLSCGTASAADADRTSGPVIFRSPGNPSARAEVATEAGITPAYNALTRFEGFDAEGHRGATGWRQDCRGDRDDRRAWSAPRKAPLDGVGQPPS